jgi:tetratricopeptide (TPR) repeat protein
MDEQPEPADVPAPTQTRRNRGRRWCIPPAILREPAELLEASHVLDEVRGELGLLLWQSVRDVTLWAALEEAGRRGLFAAPGARARLGLLPAAGGERLLEVPLTTLAALVGAPDAAVAPVVTLACLEVARWAEARGATGTALSFAQAGALADPEDPEAALEVAELAVRARRDARAETWLRRTVGLARRAGAWDAYAAAYVGLGTVYARRAQPGPARRFLVKALRAARRHGLGERRGDALVCLFRIARDAGDAAEAERFARGAVRAYRRAHPAVPGVLHDLAALWVARDDFARALPLLQRLLPGRTDPAARVVTLSLAARAAAGLGERRVFEEAWAAAWALLRRLDDAEIPPATLVELARAAAVVKDWPRMEQAVRHASGAAARRDAPPLDLERLFGPRPGGG